MRDQHVLKRARVRHNETEKCACDEVFCLHPPSRARHLLMSTGKFEKIDGVSISQFSVGDLLGPQTEPSQTVFIFGLNPQTNHDLAIGDLAVGCLGVHAMESLDVHVLLPPIL